jgi:hypothetical protein
LTAPAANRSRTAVFGFTLLPAGWLVVGLSAFFRTDVTNWNRTMRRIVVIYAKAIWSSIRSGRMRYPLKKLSVIMWRMNLPEQNLTGFCQFCRSNSASQTLEEDKTHGRTLLSELRMPLGRRTSFTERKQTERKAKDYCKYCYEYGAFSADCTMLQMIDYCVQPNAGKHTRLDGGAGARHDERAVPQVEALAGIPLWRVRFRGKGAFTLIWNQTSQSRRSLTLERSKVIFKIRCGRTFAPIWRRAMAFCQRGAQHLQRAPGWNVKY